MQQQLNEKLSFLADLPLFQGLTTEQLEHVSHFLQPRKFPRGGPLMSAQDVGQYAYLITAGTVKIHVIQLNGDDIILAIRGRGELIGELSLIDGLARSATVTALEPTTTYVLYRDDFESCLEAIPLVGRNLLKLLARRLRRADMQTQVRDTQDVYGKVARQLLDLAEEYGSVTAEGYTVIGLRLTQDNLAGLIGTTRESVNKALGFYIKRKWIARNRSRQFLVLEAAQLVQRCQ